MKRVITIVLLICVLSITTISAFTLSGEGNVIVTEKDLADGVKYTQIKAGKTYNNVQFDIFEVDLSKDDIVIDNVYGNKYITHANKTTSEMIKEFNGKDRKKALAAINAELWTVTYAHSRVEGSGTTYGGASDPVVKKALLIPRGYNVIDGEIVSTGHMTQETPFEGDFWSFGITEDNIPILSNPTATVTINNQTKNTNTKADGINRLPAKNALVMYTDKGCLNNYALDDAYEIVIKITSTEDYIIKHGTDITGEVIAIYGPENSENPLIGDNHIILTARGNKVNKISDYQIGDKVNFQVSVKDKANRYTDEWQRAKTATGGHIPFVINGKFQNVSPGGSYPTAFLGITNDKKVVMGTYGSAEHDGGRVGIAGYKDLSKDLCFKEAFIFDGGGSATAVVLDENEYKVVNNPSDKGGVERPVLNCLVVSVIEPEPSATNKVATGDTHKNNNQLISIIAIIATAALIIIVVYVIASKKKVKVN